MTKTTFFKTMLLAVGMLFCGSNVWGQTTRTWDFTDNATWSTINATGYYAINGTESNSTAFDESTAVYMQLDNVTYHSEHFYDIGNGTTTSAPAGVPDKNYVSIKVPAGYTLTVNGCVAGGGTGQSNQLTIRGGEIETYYSSMTFKDIVYVNNTEATITAYIYDPTAVDNRYMRIKTITLTSGIESLTAITDNTFWDFTNRAYTFKYGGTIYDNIFFGRGVEQVTNSKLDLKATGNPSTGNDYTVQIKIPANQAIGLLVNMGGSNGRPTKISDGTNTLFTINATYGSKDTPVSIAATENERTLYFYNTNYDASYGYIKYIYVYTKQSVNIGSTGWATLYTPCALDFSGVSGLTAYTATCSEATVTLTEVSNVPAGTGVILKGTPNTNYDIPVTGSSSTAKGHLTGEFLNATAYNKFNDPEYTIYVLTPVNGGSRVQFNPVTSGEVAAGKAYLKISGEASSLARSLSVVFADETTAISEKGIVTSEKSATAHYYDLQGRRIAQPTKGLYIKHGKKIFKN